MNHRQLFAILLLMFLAAFAICRCAIVAQEAAADPFGGEAPKAATPPAADKKKKEPEKVETDRLVLTIRESNPKTPAELMTAARNLVDYGRPDEAKKYVVALLAAAPDVPTLAALQAKFGSALFFRLATIAELDSAGRQLSDVVLSAAHKLARDPARLDGLMKQLADPAPEKRHAALVDLATANEDAVVAILAVLNDPSRSAEHPILRAAIIRLGPMSVPPLLGAMGAPDETFRSQVIDVLDRLEARDAIPFLLRPAIAGAENSAERAAARATVVRLAGGLPTKSEAEAFLLRRATNFFQGELPGKPDHEERITFWRWNATQQRVVREHVEATAAPLAEAGRFAEQLTQLAPTNREYRRLYLASILEAEKLRIGWDVPLPMDAGTPFAVAAAVEIDGLEDVLRFALQQERMACAVAVLEVLGTIGNATLVQSAGGQPRIVTQALRHADRRVRFAALQAIGKTQPQAPFAGASFLPEAVGYFIQTAGHRRVLIAHPRTEQVQAISGIFNEFQMTAEITTTGARAFNFALKNPDIEFVLISEAIAYPNVSELVQQFRREPRTAHIPIGLLTQDVVEKLEYQTSREPRTTREGEVAPVGDVSFNRLRLAFEHDALTEVFRLPTNVTGVGFVTRQLIDRAGTSFVSSAERMKQATAALDQLAILVDHPQRFGFYECLPLQPAVEQALKVPSLAPKATQVLSRFGTPTAQKILVNLASDSVQSLADRQAAQAGFANAVNRRGVLLTRSEILIQYERYNRSATLDVETQKVLGAILDVIEGSADSTKSE